MAATVPQAYLRTLSDAINRLSANAKAIAQGVIRNVIASSGTDNPFDLVEDLEDALEPIFEALANGTASLSANSYDLLRLASVGGSLGATPYPDRDREWTLKALYGIAKDHRGNMDAFANAVLSRLDYEAKRAAGSTMFENGFDDPLKPRFARVPTGAETCPFCVMLASRGFVYHSTRSAGKLDHYHENCDCRIVPQFGGESYEGYDPDDYLDQYAEMMDRGDLSEERLARSSERARQRRRAEAAELEAETVNEIREDISAGKVLTFDAKSPDGREIGYQMSPEAIKNARGEFDAIGLGKGNEAELAREIMKRSAGHSFKEHPMGHGFYEQNVRMRGPDGKVGRVNLVWKVKEGRAILVDAEFLKLGSKR